MNPEIGYFTLLHALGEPLGSRGARVVQVYPKPLIRWIWLGALIKAFGGSRAVIDPRYRKLAVRNTEKQTADDPDRLTQTQNRLIRHLPETEE